MGVEFTHRLIEAPPGTGDPDPVSVPDRHKKDVPKPRIPVPDTDPEPCDFCDHAPAVADGYCEACVTVADA